MERQEWFNIMEIKYNIRNIKSNKGMDLINKLKYNDILMLINKHLNYLLKQNSNIINNDNIYKKIKTNSFTFI